MEKIQFEEEDESKAQEEVYSFLYIP